MLIYIFKSAACMAIFFVFYKLLLERENMHVFKRFYLLLALTTSLVIPALVFTEYVVVEPVAPSKIQYTKTTTDYDYVGVPQALENDVLDIEPILWTTYFLGFAFFGLRFIRNLFQIVHRVRKNPKQKTTRFIQVLLKENFPPHTFFKYIFLNKEKLEANEIPQEVLLHEETHARQKHSWDIVLIELFQVVFWFNPLVYLFKKAIKLNHEFLADQAVLNGDIDKTTYQNTLLLYVSADSEKMYQSLPKSLGIVNSINYSSIKKRFKIMKTHTSKKAVLLRSLLLLPLLTLMLFGFSESKQIQIQEGRLYDSEIQKINPFQEELDEINSAEIHITQTPGATHIMMLEYDKFITNYNTTKSVSYGNYERAIVIYNLMSDEQKKSVQKYPEIPLANDISIQEIKSLEINKFKEYKNKGKYAIWLDGKVIDNNILNDYQASDIVYFSESFVYINARSSRFPQEYQVSLYTEEGFEKHFRKSKVNQYNSLLERYLESSEIFYLNLNFDNSELRILKEQLDQIFKRIPKVDRIKYNVKPSPKVPTFKKAINEQIAKYNKLAKKYNAIPIKKRQIPMSDLKILETIFRKMNSTQKADSQPFPECLPKNIQDGISQKLIKEYNALAKEYNRNLSKSKSIQIKKNDVDRLEYLYSLMSDKQKANAEPFPNFPEPPSPPKVPRGMKGEASNIPPPPSPNLSDEEFAEKVVDEIIANQDPYDHSPISSIFLKGGVNKFPAYSLPTQALRTKKGVKRDIPQPPTPEKMELKLIEETLEEEIKIQEIIAVENVQVYEYNADKPITNNPSLMEYLGKPDLLDAQFYFDDKKITKKKGMNLIRNRKDITVETYPWTNKKPEIKIYGVVKRKSNIPLPPTPPKPKSPLDHIIEMTKEGAIFKYNGKIISSDKAINLIKNNKDLSISTEKKNNDKPIVKISKYL